MKSNQFDSDRLSKIPITEVAEKLGLRLIKNKCLCFIHEEKTPSFSINPKKNIWNCFGCGKGGGVIKLVQEFNNYDFIEACKWLSNAFSISNYNLKRTVHKKKSIKIISKCKADSEVYKWFFDNLLVTEKVRLFIEKRCYPECIIEEYNIKGLDDCKTFFEKCKTKWGIDRLLNCGLAKEIVNKDTGEIITKFTWWTSTLFFPFYNKDGDIVYIQGRTLNPEYEKKYKYVNLSGVETIPFNLSILNSMTKNETLVITEGLTDCISCCLMNKKAIGIIGAGGFKREYVETLKDFEINVIPDNDKNNTGDKFADKIKSDFRTIGKMINIISLIGYKDISEYYMAKWNHGKIN